MNIKTNKYISVLLALISLLLIGCASTGNQQLGKCNKYDIDCKIVKNVTTKTDILCMFGDPQEIDFDIHGKEKWKYSFKKSSEMPINFVPIISAFKSGTNDTSKNLVIIFNQDETVSHHAFSEAKGETTIGIVG